MGKTLSSPVSGLAGQCEPEERLHGGRSLAEATAFFRRYARHIHALSKTNSYVSLAIILSQRRSSVQLVGKSQSPF